MFFSHQVVSDSLWGHELQCTRSPYPSLSLGACPCLCPLSWWCYSTSSFSVTLFFFLKFFPASESFPTNQFFTSDGQSTGGLAFNEYSGLISFKTDWFFLLAVQGALKSLLQHMNSNGSILTALRHTHPIFTFIHDYWKDHSFDYMDICQQSEEYAFKYTV